MLNTSSDERPLWIGITTRHGDPTWLAENTRNYIARVREAGHEPVILSPDHPAILPDGRTLAPDTAGRLPAGLPAALDGLILDPRYFQAPLAGADPDSIDPKRDELELALAQEALAEDLPLFGICRGCQVLNVAAGGGMVQHFDGHRTPQGDATRFHGVAVTPASRLQAITGVDEFTVNTFHHQGLDLATLAPIFVPAAVALPDPWLVEAYESAAHRWVLGVQWHPERSFELDEPHRRLWESFFAACRRRQSERGESVARGASAQAF
jgi:putative glutamine amidotransferase